MSSPLPYATPPTLSRDAIIRAESLRKTFQMGDATIEVLKNVDLSLKPGEFVAIEGRSGSGKSTLLHILGALDFVDGGSVRFDGRDYTRRAPASISGFLSIVTTPFFFRSGIILLFAAAASFGFWVYDREKDLSAILSIAFAALSLLLFFLHFGGKFIHFLQWYREEKIAAQLRNKEFGFVFQFYHLLPELNVLENTLLTAMVEHSWLGFRSNRKRLQDRATELLNQLGLSHRLKHRPNQLSGGERQRVAIARALMNQPKVLFADEPTGNLDYETGRQIMTLLEKLHQEKKQTILMVTHDRTLAREADRVLLLKEGRLTAAE